MNTPSMEAEMFRREIGRDARAAWEWGDRTVHSPSDHPRSAKKRSILHSRFHIKLIATYLTPILLLPLFVFHNTPKTRCAYVMVLVFVNWVTRTLPLGVTALMPLLYLPALRIISYDQVVGMYMNRAPLPALLPLSLHHLTQDTQAKQRFRRMDPGAFYGKFAAKVPPDYSDDSDLDSSSDEEPENAVLARTTPPADSEDEEVSGAPSAGSIDNALEEIPKFSKDSPTWKAVRGSSSNAMPEWKDVPPYPSPVESPITYFRNFFDVTFLSHICEQSSLYSAQRNPNKVTSMTVNDLEQFIGTVLTMSLMKLPQTRMYWSQRFRVSQVADTMTRDRWEEIKQSLHFSDNQEAPDQNDPELDRLYKVRPLFDHLVAKCHEIPKSQKLCVDEQLVPFKGRSSLKQYLPNKLKKMGL
ncbi:hypothetical protein HPB51_006253 [Rhipicephalus microplus]|uniref:PiggyBac transposable element-derived protein domain-containing protein n=1 Tax=Rhipicephalus microplus TaxID=6941 RepID=A0A9J6DLD9_RHIMP|nr:hypothetical protein HPB51_006253 [Rhipicephalus microplus]